MCTAMTYRTDGFYFGRTLDYEFSYGEEVTVTPRRFPFVFRHIGPLETHYAMIGMAHALGMVSLAEGVDDGYQLQQIVRRRMGRWVNDTHRRRPMIVPVVVQT